jgi:transposase-like protein
MAKDLFDDQCIEIPCSDCGHEEQKTIAWIRANDRYSCSSCGAAIILQSEKLLAGLDEANKRISEIFGPRGKKR